MPLAAQERADLAEQELQQQRARIAAERAHESAKYEQARADCYQKFAVNDCLRQARVDRRPRVEELRRQEIILNDEERRRLSVEQLQSTENKQAEQAANPPPASTSKDRQGHGADTMDRAQQRQSYESKQRQAEEHKADLQRRQAEKNGKSTQALPKSP